MEQNKKIVGNERWRYLVICALGLFFLGILYAWSILKTPLAQEFGWETAALALNYTLMMCFFCVGSLASGALSKRVPFQWLLLAGGILICAGFVLVSYLQAGCSIGLLYLFYGGLFGSGVGVAYNALLSIGNSWFPDKRGTSSGFMMMLYGLSTMFLGNAAAKLFEIEGIGWRGTFRLLGVAVLAAMVLCAFALKKPTADICFPQKERGQGDKGECFEQRDYTTAEVVKRPAYWLFYVYGALAATVGSAVISFARELSLTLGAQAALATTLVGVLSVCNGLGRVFCGFCFDALGRRNTMLAVSAITLAAPIIMLFALWQNSLGIGVFSLCLTGISYGCCPTISSAFISSFYGMKDFPMNYSIGNTKMLFSSFAATAASALLTSTGSYTAPFIMLTVFAAFSMALNFAIKRP